MAQKYKHNKIINNAAKEILEPIGVFQKGQSRIWIDDNGWFLTIIDFQPSGWSKGAYLNVGMHFLWTKKEYFSFDFSFDVGTRVHGYVEYTGNDLEFYNEIIGLSKIAEKEIQKYRKYEVPSFAKKQLLQLKNRM
jgi:hypothetical protein